jgi:ankyrin repeat protein
MNCELIMSTIHCAIRCSNSAYLELLIKNINTSVASQNDGKTAIMWACFYDNYEALEVLIKYTPDTELQQIVNMKDDSGGTNAIRVIGGKSIFRFALQSI